MDHEMNALCWYAQKHKERQEAIVLLRVPPARCERNVVGAKNQGPLHRGHTQLPYRGGIAKDAHARCQISLHRSQVTGLLRPVARINPKHLEHGSAFTSGLITTASPIAIVQMSLSLSGVRLEVQARGLKGKWMWTSGGWGT